MKDVIGQFENKLLEALKFKYKRLDEQIKASLIETSFVKVIDIEKFYDLYLGKSVYPQERIKKLIYQLFDIKIEMFYILELDIGLYNHLIYNIGFDNSNIDEFPYIALRKLSLDQTLVIKSRILWERVMNFIYYLETGADLDEIIRGSKKKSKKTHFFDFIKNTKWSYLEEYRNYIEWFDNRLRIPEVHKGSILRKYFQTGRAAPDRKTLGLINIVNNSIWTNLLEIIQGSEPSSRFWTIDMDLSEGIEIFVEGRFRGLVDEGWARRIAQTVLKAEGVVPPYEVSLVFTDSETVKQLNRDYRGIDEPTDVLAFYMLPQNEVDDSFALPPDGVTRLGEVIISYPQAVEQAREQGHSPERELALLIIHGILHLLGYDHEEPGEEAKMRSREKELLGKCLPY